MEIRVRNNFGKIGDFTPSQKTEQIIEDLKNLQAGEEALTAVQLSIADIFEMQVQNMVETQLIIAEMYEMILS